MLESDENKENKTTTCAGTPDYLPPEILMGVKCGPEVDWWALGCIMYEFLIGITPFYGDTTEEIFENILQHGRSHPRLFHNILLV